VRSQVFTGAARNRRQEYIYGSNSVDNLLHGGDILQEAVQVSLGPKAPSGTDTLGAKINPRLFEAMNLQIGGRRGQEDRGRRGEEDRGKRRRRRGGVSELGLQLMGGMEGKDLRALPGRWHKTQ